MSLTEPFTEDTLREHYCDQTKKIMALLHQHEIEQALPLIIKLTHLLNRQHTGNLKLLCGEYLLSLSTFLQSSCRS